MQRPAYAEAMANAPVRTPVLALAVAWDQTNRASYSFVSGLVNDPSAGVTVVAPGLDRATGNLLDDQVVPAFQSADRIAVVWSQNDPLWVAFQAGMATGMQKPTMLVAASRRDAAAASHVNFDTQLTMTPRALLSRIRRPVEPPETPRLETNQRGLLCPRGTTLERQIFRALSQIVHRSGQRRASSRTKPPVFADLVWVITPHDVDPTGKESNLAPNFNNAFQAGRSYGAMIRLNSRLRLSILRVGAVPPVPALEHLTHPVTDAKSAADAIDGPSNRTFRLTKVAMRDLKCFESLEIGLSTSSPLGGAWTCIAGVNGAGKSSILQAIALALLGRRHAPELGLTRLARMVRRPAGSDWTTGTEIRLTVEDGNSAKEVVLPLAEYGIDDKRLASMSDQTSAEQLWEHLAGQLIASFGATRNISDTPSGPISMSPHAHRQLTLFDPLAQIMSADALTLGGARFHDVLETLAKLVTLVLDEPDAPFVCEVDELDQLVFLRDGVRLGALDLPDGFRSILALLADLAAGWHEIHPTVHDIDPADINGIVLVDEIDLHLHARLQRMIVPRLRTALPNVQWIVTTHSPLIAASFDRTELVLLDRSEPDGLRELDRQIMGFTANDLYDWVLDTVPVSETGEAQIAADTGTALLYQSPIRNQEQAEQLLAGQDALLAQLRTIEAG